MEHIQPIMKSVCFNCQESEAKYIEEQLIKCVENGNDNRTTLWDWAIFLKQGQCNSSSTGTGFITIPRKGLELFKEYYTDGKILYSQFSPLRKMIENFFSSLPQYLLQGKMMEIFMSLH